MMDIGKDLQDAFMDGYNYRDAEIVRCKDCRFHEREEPGMVYCPATVGGWVEENWFCKGGERRSE